MRAVTLENPTVSNLVRERPLHQVTRALLFNSQVRGDFRL